MRSFLNFGYIKRLCSLSFQKMKNYDFAYPLSTARRCSIGGTIFPSLNPLISNFCQSKLYRLSTLSINHYFIPSIMIYYIRLVLASPPP